MAKKQPPKQKRLPGTQGKITKLDQAALRLYGHRTDRIAAGLAEAEAQGDVLSEMHKAKRTHYSRRMDDGRLLEIDLVVEKEKAKVRISAAADDQGADG